MRHKDGSTEVVPIICGEIVREESYTKHSVLQTEGSKERFGYIKLPSFYREERKKEGDFIRTSSRDMKLALIELRGLGVSGIILDLRDNRGGSLLDAEGISELFVDGPVVQVRGYHQDDINSLGGEDPAIYHGPLVVLVNRVSASASEILASALQDYKRAVIVGSQTRGKGTVQKIISIDHMLQQNDYKFEREFGSILLTTKKFYRVSGDSVQARGVLPDIVLPNIFDGIEEIGERYEDFSLPWDSIKPLPFWPSSETLPLAELQERSQKRVAESEKFQNTIKKVQFFQAREGRTEREISLTAVRSLRAEGEKAKESFKTDEIDPGLLVSRMSLDKKLPPEYGEAWREELQKDPQVGEAVEIIRDLSLLQGREGK